MKGVNVISINQATMVEAMQLYFDAQLATKQLVVSVKKDGTKYGSCDEFTVEFNADGEAVQP